MSEPDASTNEDEDDGTSWQESAVDPLLQPADSTRDLGCDFGLSASPTAQHAKCRNAFILSLIKAIDCGDRGIHYGRDRNGFGPQLPKAPPWWSYRLVAWTADNLAEAPDFFISHRQKPSPPNGRSRTRSSIHAGPALLGMRLGEFLIGIARPPVARIELRDSRKRLLPLKDDATIRATAEFFHRYDPAVRGLSIKLEMPGVIEVSSGVYVTVGGEARRIDTTRRELVRIFNRTQKSGGRFYRGFWQSLPRAMREHLTIDGARVVELDRPACHLRVVYQAAGVDWPFRDEQGADPYVPASYGIESRPLFKIATSIFWNCGSVDYAIGAITREMSNHGHVADAKVASEIVAAITAHHDPIQRLFFRKIGRSLMFIESEAIMHALGKLLDLGVVGLPVHDSIIVASQHAALTELTMTEAFERVAPALARNRLAYTRKKAGFRGSGLTIGGGGRVRVRGGERGCDSNFSPPTSKPPGRHRDCIQSAELNPALDELAALAKFRGKITPGHLRGWLLIATLAGGSIADLVAQASAMEINIPTPMLELERCGIGVRDIVITRTALRKLCSVTAREASALALQVLQRQASTPRDADRRRAARWNAGVVPRIVDVAAAEPWLEDHQSRTRWYGENNGSIGRQVLGLLAFIRRKKVDEVAEVEARLSEVKRVRDRWCRPTHVPIDDLFEGLDQVLRSSRMGTPGTRTFGSP